MHTQEKGHLVDKLYRFYEKTHRRIKRFYAKLRTKYDLVANIVHNGKPKTGTYRVHIHHDPTSTWFVCPFYYM